LTNLFSPPLSSKLLTDPETAKKSKRLAPSCSLCFTRGHNARTCKNPSSVAENIADVAKIDVLVISDDDAHEEEAPSKKRSKKFYSPPPPPPEPTTKEDLRDELIDKCTYDCETFLNRLSNDEARHVIKKLLASYGK
jgi:hypothetical protein